MEASGFTFLDGRGNGTYYDTSLGTQPLGERLLAVGRQGHWKTTSLIAAFKQSGIVAPLVLDDPITPAARQQSLLTVRRSGSTRAVEGFHGPGHHYIECGYS